MNVNHFDISKTGILFFDLLNSFIHGGDEDAQARKMPMVRNAVRLMRASRAAALPIFSPRRTIALMASRPRI